MALVQPRTAALNITNALRMLASVFMVLSSGKVNSGTRYFIKQTNVRETGQRTEFSHVKPRHTVRDQSPRCGDQRSMPVSEPAGCRDEQHPGLRQSVAADSVGCGLCFSDVRRPGKSPSGSALDSKPCHGAPVECALTCRGHDAGRPRHPAGVVCHRSAAVDACSDTRVGHSDSSGDSPPRSTACQAT